MLRGDLRSTPLADLLERLASAQATGCIYVQPASRRRLALESTVVLRDGAIWGVAIPGSDDSVGTRLVATNHLSQAALQEAREVQETELATWGLANLLIHLGLADEQLVCELVAEQALSDLTVLCSWESGSWRFRRRDRRSPNLLSGLPVTDALEKVRARRHAWDQLLPVILGADAVVSLAAGHGAAMDAADEPAAAVEMAADDVALLCAVDGVRTVAELGKVTGFTLLSAATTIAKLAGAGLVALAAPAADDDVPADADPSDGDADAEPLSAIAAALSFDVGESLLPENFRRGFLRDTGPGEPAPAPPPALNDPLSRVSAALSAAMGDAGADAEPAAEEFVAVEPEVEAEAGVEAAAVEPEIAAEPEIVAEPEIAAAPELDVPALTLSDLAAVELLPLAEETVALEPQAFALLEADPPGEPELLNESLAEAIAELEAAPDVPEAIAVDAEPPPEPEPEPEPVASWDEPVDNEPVDNEPVLRAEVAAEFAEFMLAPAAPAETPAEPPVEVEAEPEPAASELPAHDPIAASRLLSQLVGEAPAPRPEPPDAALEEPDEPADEPAPAAPAELTPQPRQERGLTDTAALMRELSSLGTEASASTRVPTVTRPAPAPLSGQHRKRKGLFGRS